MNENIITSIVRNWQVTNFQQLMVMGGKGFVNKFSLHLCFFCFLQIMWVGLLMVDLLLMVLDVWSYLVILHC
jgi:hypothetical protein